MIVVADRFYIAIFSALTALAFHSTWVNSFFIARFWIATEVVYLQSWHGWCHMKLLLSRRVLCTPYNHAPCHFMQSHIRKVHACLAVTYTSCHRRFWYNDQDLLRAAAVTRGWNEYRNKSQHRKLTPEKKIIPPILQRFEPATFQSRVRRSNYWAIPALNTWLLIMAYGTRDPVFFWKGSQTLRYRNVELYARYKWLILPSVTGMKNTWMHYVRQYDI